MVGIISGAVQMPGRLPTWGRIEVSNVPAHYVFISPLRSNTFCQMNFSTFQLKINEFSPSRCFFFFLYRDLALTKETVTMVC